MRLITHIADWQQCAITKLDVLQGDGDLFGGAAAHEALRDGRERFA